ncbi:MAG: Conserved hypothetical protein, gene in Ubiquinol-cytochrome C chaperone locus [uncultured Craurococcus sp.]|uniref:DUF177 domain-containing protein n=1 Tax=uncultured Craurococcus sp. TaxID=1135998 RepID=A0A6J4H0J6_9PROT|nr:MAG: Conserved hypothetical protein, gene in Ubiquinol-cytochrome C chaperone locus [uncultured Craurococcus sp.]
MPPDQGPEFSRPLALGMVREGGRHLSLTATPAECAALAARFGILALDGLSAELHLTMEPEGTVRAKGRVAACLTQACIVTLEPVPQAVDEPVAFRLLPPGREPQDGPDDIDEIECPDGTADLGEAVAEQLALALDPYPRAPGAELPDEATDRSADAFAALSALRRN